MSSPRGGVPEAAAPAATDEEQTWSHDSPLTAVREFARILRPHRQVLIWGGALTFLGGLAGLAQPMAAMMLLDALEAGETIRGAIIVLTLALAVGTVVNSVGYYMLARVAESVVYRSRRALVRRVLWMPISRTGRFESGDLLSRISSDTTLMRQVIGASLVELVTGVLLAGSIIVMMAVVDPVMLLVTGGVLVATLTVIGLIQARVQRYSRKSQEALARLSVRMERVLGAFRMVKASGAEPGEERRAAEPTKEAWEYGLRLARLEAFIGGGVMVSVQLSFIIVLGLGGYRVTTGAIDIGQLVAFQLYLFYLMQPVMSLVAAVSSLNVGAAALRRIQQVMAVEPEMPEGLDEEGALDRYPAPERPGDWSGLPASVEFQDVVFGYPGRDNPTVLHGVNLMIPPCGFTAVVGPSGAGKSTLFALLERFYSPDRGRVLMDGRDLADWPLPLLRASIGYVEQDAPVMAGTLRENLLMGGVEATMEEIDEMLARVGLENLVDRLPDGVDSRVGTRGSTLSGGERQRVAVARALLRRPRLLLLDEATSQLDTQNETIIRDVLADVSERTTVIVVAHRLSTVTKADQIVLIDGGVVGAVGSHQELLGNSALYAELAAGQFLTSELVENGAEEKATDLR
ncbi:ABC transporter ATP-binding protein [Nocardiopsis dassonvillei]|uniref:ABC transporter ATP-binding protein n=1 Tax=Nocardiopsis dassonvillei TaxID=2014 RepID=UPI00200C86A3|nr:ABC transporter ATP-binding protein [Nocardiopsis dassonvillei]MCK9868093.1 ABC transporter ATP-binding protein/permease [Nocardiopsis dassonvillei]